MIDQDDETPVATPRPLFDPNVTCPQCEGTGVDGLGNVCGTCHGASASGE